MIVLTLSYWQQGSEKRIKASKVSIRSIITHQWTRSRFARNHLLPLIKFLLLFNILSNINNPFKFALSLSLRSLIACLLLLLLCPSYYFDNVRLLDTVMFSNTNKQHFDHLFTSACHLKFVICVFSFYSRVWLAF